MNYQEEDVLEAITSEESLAGTRTLTPIKLFLVKGYNINTLYIKAESYDIQERFVFFKIGGNIHTVIKEFNIDMIVECDISTGEFLYMKSKERFDNASE